MCDDAFELVKKHGPHAIDPDPGHRSRSRLYMDPCSISRSMLSLLAPGSHSSHLALTPHTWLLHALFVT